MKLTREQRDAVRHDGHAFVEACPGSGKTRAIVAKLLRSVEAVRGTPRRIACITYTNAAVYEIEHRMRVLGAAGDDTHFDVSTIHAFCQNNILRHYYWRLAEYADGCTVLPSDSEEYVGFVKEIGDEYGLDGYARQGFESLNRKPTGEPIAPDNVPAEAAIEFWKTLETNGYVDFCNIVYWSYRLLSDHPSIAKSLAATYANLLVDEFQDTSALQVEILTLIANEDLTAFFLVGDPEQSIYSFAGAERGLMFDFAAKLGARTFPLSGNFRSSTPIIVRSESLIPRNPTMFAAGDAARFTEEPICEHVENPFTAITERFLPMLEGLRIPLGDAAVLATSWYQLMPLGRQLRNYGVAVVGPGARPYKKRHLFVGLAEQICAYLEKPTAALIRQLERELFNLIQNVTGKADFRVFEFQGRRTVFRLVDVGRAVKDEHEAATEWLRLAAEQLSEILHEDGFLPREYGNLLPESVEDIVRDMEGQRDLDVANLTLEDLGMFASPDENLKLLTMHGAKGREFSAVALIGLHDGRIPYHNNYNALTESGLEEARRQMYVAVTRAKRLLMLFTDREDYRPLCRFLAEMSFRAE